MSLLTGTHYSNFYMYVHPGKQLIVRQPMHPVNHGFQSKLTVTRALADTMMFTAAILFKFQILLHIIILIF